MNAVTLKNIYFFRNKTPILQDFSLSVEQGERMVLQGPSGIGKTTLLRIIAGLEHPHQGQVYIFGQLATDGKKILIPPHKRGIGMVFQDLALWPNMSVWQNLELPLKAIGLDKKQRTKRIQEMLELCQINNLENRKPAQLSGGQQQRVALARALILRPKLLLLDEPLTNIDQQLKEDLLQLLLTMHKRFALTMIYVTHITEEASFIATRIVNM